MSVSRSLQWVLGLALIFTLPLWIPEEFVDLVNFIAISIIAALGLQLLTGYTGIISLGQAAFLCVGAVVAGILAMKPAKITWEELDPSGT